MSTFKVPPVGSVVTVTCRSRNHYYLRTEEYTDTVYENLTVIRPFPWTKPDEFCIPAVGEPYITVRTINMSCVVDLKVHGKQGEVNADTSTDFRTIPGTNGTFYTVTMVNGVAKSCGCLGFEYRKTCRHLRMAMGETPVNPRRATAPKPQVKKAPKQKVGGVTKADLVRQLIRDNKATMTMDVVTDMVMSRLGFAKGLAQTYVRNNWEKV